MRNSILLLAISLFAFDCSFAQQALYVEAPLANSTSTQTAPNGMSSGSFLRTCALVLQTELGAIPPTSTITQIGFTLVAGSGPSVVSGNLTVFLQNTSDVSYLKGTNWSTIITGMSSVYANVVYPSDEVHIFSLI